MPPDASLPGVLSLVCVRGVGGPVGKNSMVFKNWRSLEKNTEGKKERGGGEKARGRWRDREGGGEASSANWSQVVI